MTDSLDERLVDLESRLAHHESMAEDLSEVVAAQGRTIDSLTQQVRRLTERLLEVEDGLRLLLPDKPPPHY